MATAPPFPTTAGVLQPTCNLDAQGTCEGDAFVSKLDPTLSGAASLLYSTYLGGEGADAAAGIAVDLSGNAYITGITNSSHLPIVGTVFQKWDAVTGGFDGFAVPTPYIFGIPIEGANGIYYLSLGVLIFVLWLSANLLRTPLGRAMVAIRDSEVSAQSMGIHLARYKTFAFAISAGVCP